MAEAPAAEALPSSPTRRFEDKMMLMCDPPHQTQLRRIVSGSFTPKAARAMGSGWSGSRPRSWTR